MCSPSLGDWRRFPVIVVSEDPSLARVCAFLPLCVPTRTRELAALFEEWPLTLAEESSNLIGSGQGRMNVRARVLCDKGHTLATSLSPHL